MATPEATVVRGTVGHLNRSEVRRRVYAGMTPGQQRQKHVMAKEEFDMEGRQWIWEYWNNYKAATVGLSMFGIVLSLCSIVLMLSAKGAVMEGRTTHRTLCDWTSKVRCSEAWTSKYWHGFGMISTTTTTELSPKEAEEAHEDADTSPAISSSYYYDLSLALLALPNDLYLILFYFFQILLSGKRGPKFVKVQLTLSALALVLAAYLAHAIVVVLGLWLCPMASVQFGLNCAIALANVTRWKALRRLEESKKQ